MWAGEAAVDGGGGGKQHQDAAEERRRDAAVDAAAKEFIAKHGVDQLPKVAKMHFRTALRAQGLPEPPRTEWRRKS